MARKKPVRDGMKAKARKAAKATQKAAKKAGKKAAGKAAKAAATKTAVKKTAVKTTASKKTAAKKAVRKATTAVSAKATRKAVTKTAGKTARASSVKAPAVKKVRAGKAARKAGVRAAARKIARKAAPKAVATPAPKRRAAPRSSAGRRLVGRTSPSRASLAKKTLETGAAKKAATTPARKPAKKRAAKTAAPATPLAVGKTARSRIVARQSKKLAPAILRDGARRRVEKPTAPRPEKKPAATRRPPFRLHALGLRDEHATDRPAIDALLAAAYGRADEAAALAGARDEDRMLCALVAEYDGELIGYLAFVRAEPFATLAAVAVAPARQGRGVGSVLVSAGIETARGAGAQAVVAPADSDWLLRFGFSAAPVFTQPRLALEIEPGALAGEDGSRTPP